MSVTSDKLVLGIIGLGDWGWNLVRCFSQLESAKIKMCCDIDSKKTHKISGAFPKIKMVLNYEDMLKDEEIKAIVISTPIETHFGLAKQALLSGKNVFIEKPMSTSAAHAGELKAIAQKQNLKIMIGHLLKYHPAIEKMKELISSGEMGEIYYMYSQRLNLGKISKDSNVLWSFGPHDISVAMYLMGSEPVSVSAIGHSFLRKQIEDIVFLNLLFKNNKAFHIHLSWLDPHKIRKITIVGSKKMAVMDDMEPVEKIKIYDKGVNPTYTSYGELLTLRFGEMYIPRFNMAEPLLVECQHFVDCILEDKAPKTDALEGLCVVKVLETAQKSILEGCKWIKL